MRRSRLLFGDSRELILSHHECRTMIVRFSQLIEDHCNPASSPWRIPVRKATRITSRRMPSELARMSAHSSGERKSVFCGGHFSHFTFGGDPGSFCHSYAVAKHLLNIASRLLTVFLDRPAARLRALNFSMCSVEICSTRSFPKN